MQTETTWSDFGLEAVRWPLQLMSRPDRHNEIELNFLEKGSLTYLFGGQPLKLISGKVFVFWAVVPHQIVHFEGTSHLYWVSVPLTLFLQWDLPERLKGAVIDGIAVSSNSNNDAAGDFMRMRQWIDDCGKRDVEGKKTMLLEVEARLRRLGRAYEPVKTERTYGVVGHSSWQKVAQMAGFIACNYTTALSADDIADAAGLHPNYAMILFRKAFGVSFMDYVNQHRVSHALRLLATTDEKVVTIALESGFNTLSWFNEVFKRLTGMSPRRYRKTLHPNYRR